jgi:hypothetical protein
MTNQLFWNDVHSTVDKLEPAQSAIAFNYNPAFSLIFLFSFFLGGSPNPQSGLLRFLLLPFSSFPVLFLFPFLLPVPVLHKFILYYTILHYPVRVVIVIVVLVAVVVVVVVAKRRVDLFTI